MNNWWSYEQVETTKSWASNKQAINKLWTSHELVRYKSWTNLDVDVTETINLLYWNGHEQFVNKMWASLQEVMNQSSTIHEKIKNMLWTSCEQIGSNSGTSHQQLMNKLWRNCDQHMNKNKLWMNFHESSQISHEQGLKKSWHIMKTMHIMYCVLGPFLIILFNHRLSCNDLFNKLQLCWHFPGPEKKELATLGDYNR